MRLHKHPVSGNSRWYEDLFGQRIAALAAALTPQTIAAARKRGRAQDLFTLAEQILARLRNAPDLLQVLETFQES
jgi:hypothetical protein